MRVLIVEDDENVRKALRRLVEADGHSVLEAACTDEALKVAAQQTSLPVVLCDVYLPHKDGARLACDLADMHPDTAIVLMSGVPDFETAVTGLHAGVVDFLVKPFSRERLSTGLQRAILVHATRRTNAEMEVEIRKQRAEIAAACAELQQDTLFMALAADLMARERADSSFRLTA